MIYRHELIERDVLPILVVRKVGDRVEPVSFEGTGFLMGNHGLLVTCWHCVANQALGDGCYYAAAFQDFGTNLLRPLRMDRIERDSNGSDLATAWVNEGHPERLYLRDEKPSRGDDVWTFGYPLNEVIEDSTLGGKAAHLSGRYLKGYIARFTQIDGVWRYELDMPSPPGLSGAPLFFAGTNTIIGVVEGEGSTEIVVERDEHDERNTLKRQVFFGRALTLPTLAGVQTEGTDRLPLRDFLEKQRRPDAHSGT